MEIELEKAKSYIVRLTKVAELIKIKILEKTKLTYFISNEDAGNTFRILRADFHSEFEILEEMAEPNLLNDLKMDMKITDEEFNDPLDQL